MMTMERIVVHQGNVNDEEYGVYGENSGIIRRHGMAACGGDGGKAVTSLTAFGHNWRSDHVDWYFPARMRGESDS